MIFCGGREWRGKKRSAHLKVRFYTISRTEYVGFNKPTPVGLCIRAESRLSYALQTRARGARSE